MFCKGGINIMLNVVCPYCNNHIVVSFNRLGEEDKNIVSDAWNLLLQEWNLKRRDKYWITDNNNLVWLSGRQDILNEMGLSKFEALKKLKKEEK